MELVRVLVVEDFLPLRRIICSLLRKRPELQVIIEASDGLEAVQKAEELQPNLILLDVGLPTLNGIEVARRIRKPSNKAPHAAYTGLQPRITQPCTYLQVLGSLPQTCK